VLPDVRSHGASTIAQGGSLRCVSRGRNISSSLKGRAPRATSTSTPERVRAKDAIPQREIPCIGSPGIEGAKQAIHECRLFAEAGEQRQVDVLCEARVAPALNRHAADEEPPAIAFDRRGWAAAWSSALSRLALQGFDALFEAVEPRALRGSARPSTPRSRRANVPGYDQEGQRQGWPPATTRHDWQTALVSPTLLSYRTSPPDTAPEPAPRSVQLQ
jgi:hypothetical protein